MSILCIIFAVNVNACYALILPVSTENAVNISKKIGITKNDTLETANEKAQRVLRQYHYTGDIPEMQWDTQYDFKVEGTVQVKISDWKDSGSCLMEVYFNGEKLDMLDAVKEDEGKRVDTGTDPLAYARTLGNYIRLHYGVDVEESKINDYLNRDIIGNQQKRNQTFSWEFDYQYKIPIILSKDKQTTESAVATHQYAGTKERPEWYMDRLQGGNGEALDDPVANPDSYEPGAVTGYNKVFNIANILISIIKWVGVALSVIILTMLGIKFLTGSIEEKAEYKKTMIPYVVGCLLLFAGSFIVQIIYDMVTGM